MPVDTLLRRDAVHVATHQNLCITHWRALPGAGDLAAMHVAVSRWAGDGPGPDSVLLNVVQDVAVRPRFGSEVRAELEAFFRDHTIFRLGAAHVFELGGLAGATVRSLLNTAFLVSRRPNPSGAFTTVEAAAPVVHSWLDGADGPWTETQLRDAEATARQLAMGAGSSAR